MSTCIDGSIAADAACAAFIAWAALLGARDAILGRIDNVLSLGAIPFALSLRAGALGADAFYCGIMGMASMAALMMPPYLIRAAGAGDVKMAAAMGAALGIRAVPYVILGSLAALLPVWLLSRVIVRRGRPPSEVPFGAVLALGGAFDAGFCGVMP